jgi:hypothetical protein
VETITPTFAKFFTVQAVSEKKCKVQALVPGMPQYSDDADVY